jgi:carbon-monoxide dehydrogenase large subunit
MTSPGPFGGGATADRWIGQRMPRREDPRLVTGRGRYIDDYQEPGTLHATFVRSSVARGRIVALDTGAALAAPGVVAVLTAADINSSARQLWHTMMGPDQRTPGRVLADGDAR